ncbi:MAG: hypothetical protein LN412_00940 [Candidatus Thermoplasmatota archaeon]|nr:hypothetical protein [Candidatus Thermoplasmatota archaeon]
MVRLLKSGSGVLREASTFLVFLVGYVAFFIGVPPTSLCVLGACISPRPEAFLLAASLPFGIPAILGVSSGVFSAALLYEWINPMGTTIVDAAMAFLVFLASCSAARRLYRARPSLETALLATWVITIPVTLLLGTYAYGLKGSGLPDAYLSILAEAIIPINIAGVFFLSLSRFRKQAEETR